MGLIAWGGRRQRGYDRLGARTLHQSDRAGSQSRIEVKTRGHLGTVRRGRGSARTLVCRGPRLKRTTFGRASQSAYERSRAADTCSESDDATRAEQATIT